MTSRSSPSGAPAADVAAAPPDHCGLARRRLLASVGAGIVAAAVALVAGASWSVAALCFTDVAAIVYVAWVGVTVAGADAAGTARLARAEDSSRAASEAVLVGAWAASLIAVFFTLAQAGDADSPGRGLLTAPAIVSVALAWISVHTVYILRYARLYFSEPEGGIDFHGEHPDYVDFAYLALTIGMTSRSRTPTWPTGACAVAPSITHCCPTSSVR
jgi:uncharacterized membrane protein